MVHSILEYGRTGFYQAYESLLGKSLSQFSWHPTAMSRSKIRLSRLDMTSPSNHSKTESRSLFLLAAILSPERVYIPGFGQSLLVIPLVQGVRRDLTNRCIFVLSPSELSSPRTTFRASTSFSLPMRYPIVLVALMPYSHV